jgi:hypothetical protein
MSDDHDRHSDVYKMFMRSTGKSIHKWHHYFEYYQRFLSPYRNTKLTFLEIGVNRGGSLRMWSQFFGPQARAVGIDVDPSCASHAADGLEIRIGDQANPTFLRQLIAEYGRFDIVIDDGGHKSNQQITSFQYLYDVCDKVYIVEDTHTSYWPGYQDRPDGQTFISFAKARIDQLHEWHFQARHFFHYGRPPSERGADPAVSAFCRTTKSITFVDSMVIFEKGLNPPRHRELR